MGLPREYQSGGTLEVTVVGPTGEPKKTIIEDRNETAHQYLALPWNPALHTIACDGMAHTALRLWCIALAMLAMPMMFLPLFAAKGVERPARYWWLIASVFVFVNSLDVMNAPALLKASALECRAARAVIAAHAYYSPSKKDFVGLLPFHATEAARLRQIPRLVREVGMVGGQFSLEVILLLLLSSQAPAAVAGAHYVFVRHQAEKHVRRSLDRPVEINVAGFVDALGNKGIKDAPPDFVLRNKARRIRNLTDLFRAETEAAEAAMKHQRVTRPTDKKR